MASQTIQTIDEYIALFPAATQEILEKVRQLIQEVAPAAQETIKYQIPTFVLHGNLISFGAYKNHIGLYPTPNGLDSFAQELAPYRSGKGTAQFPLDQPIPYDLIRKITAFRVAENEAKAQAKKKK
jgi:uncharacterized protein YdhG (YjbR/CyaY superfamily)